VSVSSPKALSSRLVAERDLALLFRVLATLRTDIPLFATVDELEWKGPTPAFVQVAASLDYSLPKK
jgi:hypothetical protein